jgi:replicative DNA helicase
LVQDSKYKYRIRRKGQCFGRETVDGVVPDDQISLEDKSNPFTNLLKQYNLLGNKHIPTEFIMNSRENRLKLLAGIIDTDGHVPKTQAGKRVVIIQTKDSLSKQIILLAQSLGFVVNCTIRERKNQVIFGGSAKDYKDQYVINISGEKLDEIPTILPRKKCIGTASYKDYFRTGIEVSHAGKGTY